MVRGYPLVPLALIDDQRDRLTSLLQPTLMPYGLVQRVRIVLAFADGLSNKAAERLGFAQMTVVGKWCQRFLELAAGGYTYDHIRHGCATLFAAFYIMTGRCAKCHRHREFLAFLRLVIDRETLSDLTCVWFWITMQSTSTKPSWTG